MNTIALSGALLLVVACSNETKSKTVDPTVASVARATTTSIDIRGNERYVFSSVTIVPSGGPAKIPAALEPKLRQIAKAYVHGGMWEPLTSQLRPSETIELFAPDVAERLGPGKPDALVLFDGTTGPRASALNATVAITLLTNLAGVPVSAAITIDANATGSATIHRTGELLLVPSAGAWKIAGYDITVTRTAGSAGPSTSSTAKATP